MTSLRPGLDLRAVLPLAALGAVVLVIIFLELCGREEAGAPLSLPTAPRVQRDTPSPVRGAATSTAGPSPTAPPTATPREAPAGGEERDGIRQLHLASIRNALQTYRQEEGAYPDTDGNIQTLCAFVESDAGCALQEVLDPLPQDPLGSSPEHGYWYASDSDTFILYAQRESDGFPECDDHPEHLKEVRSLLCLRGP